MRRLINGVYFLLFLYLYATTIRMFGIVVALLCAYIIHYLFKIVFEVFFEYILLFIGQIVSFSLCIFLFLCRIINCQSNVYMKNKILLLGLFCCSLISAEAQVLLDKGTGKNSFPIVSSSTNAVVCFDYRRKRMD